MTHLTPAILLDLAEGAADDAASAHLVQCVECREQLASLELLLRELQADAGPVPEPSPLFWDHLSARVREAVAQEPVAHRAWWHPVAGWRAVAVATGIAAILLFVVWPPDARVPPASGTPMVSSVDRLVQEPVTAAGRDESLTWLEDLAADVDWDEASEVAVGSDASDWAVATLSDAEREELHRLLQEALTGSGV